MFQDYEHVQMLQERFQQFARDTEVSTFWSCSIFNQLIFSPLELTVWLVQTTIAMSWLPVSFLTP